MKGASFLGVGLALLPLLALWLEGRNPRHRQAHERLRLHYQSWLMQAFGLPFTEDAFGARPPQAGDLGSLKSHRVLRERLALGVPNRNYAHYSLHADVLLQDEKDRYWLARCAYVLPQRHKPDTPIEEQTPPLVLPLNELRVRRALFNDPPAYQKAFGQAPTRAGLDAWRKAHPEQDPPED